MRLGKISESVWKRSVLKPIKKNGMGKAMGVGIDGARLQIPEGMELVAATDPITTAYENITSLAIHTVRNDIAVTGAAPVAVLVTLLLSEDILESDLQQMMKELCETCNSCDMEVIGGHSEVTDAVTRPVVVMTGLGLIETERDLSVRNCREGQEIVMTKGIGIEGTAILSYDRENELLNRFSPSFVRQCQSFLGQISIAEEAMVAAEYASALHDVSEGGLFGALWELGEGSGLGLFVDQKKILVKQETIEVCELFDINPYTLISGGTLLAITDHGEELVRKLEERGIAAAVIGQMTKEHARMIINGEEHRYLERPKGDTVIRVNRKGDL